VDVFLTLVGRKHYSTKCTLNKCIYQYFEYRVLMFSFFSFLGWGETESTWYSRPLIGLVYQPQTIDDYECGAVGGMRTGRANRSTRRKPAPVPLCPPQIPHDLTWARTRAATI
jgi:hypothetical protein